MLARTLLLLGLACTGLSAGASADDAGVRLGREVFLGKAEPQCGLCHKLADAQSVGAVGPALDALKPNAERVRVAVTNGVGIMPAYEGLTTDQIEAVAQYVATVTARP